MELSFNLGLSAIPETTDSAMFPELVRLYNAIRITASMLDSYTGNTPTVEEGEEKRPAQINNFHTFTLPAGEDISVGRCVYVYNNSGTAEIRTGSALVPIHGIALETKAEGEICRFMLKGLIYSETANLIPGMRYRHVLQGYMQAESQIATSYWAYQVVGYAIDTNYLWFDPDTNWNAYTDPNPP